MKVVKDPQTGEIHGSALHVRSGDPQRHAGGQSQGQRQRFTGSRARHAIPAEVRLYDHLFCKRQIRTKAEPGQTSWTTSIRIRWKSCARLRRLEPSLDSATLGSRFQFERLGYFCVDPDSQSDATGLQPHGALTRYVGQNRKEIAILTTNLLVILGVMLLLWLVSLWRHDASIVDPFWGTGFVLLGWLSFLQQEATATARAMLLLGMVTAWGLRLSLYLLWRNWGHGEDPRYAAMRTHHGTSFWWISLGTVFGLQGLLLWIISFPIQWCLLQTVQPRFGTIDRPGVAVLA